jgi:hypothetical protein
MSGQILHIVMFKYRSEEEGIEVAKRFQALATDCLSKDGKPYLASLVGGVNNSTEGFDRDLEVKISLIDDLMLT